MSSNLILNVDHVSKSFGTGNSRVDAVKDVLLKITKGELVLIMGPSGSGKTTLLSMLGGLLKPSSGRIVIDGVDISQIDQTALSDIRARKVGFIFQSFNLMEALTVKENILFPAQLIPEQMNQAKKRADELIERLGLSSRCNALPSTLSGGEKQRVAIARALINQPPLILADEPTGNLDSQSGQEVMMVLHDVAKEEGRSVIIVSHDPRIEDVADHILWLEDGAIRDRLESDYKWTHCPVCNMRVDEQRASFTSTYNDNRYFFCSERCYQKFYLRKNEDRPDFLTEENATK
jgi:putative ABC transport system ATP-binding protein